MAIRGHGRRWLAAGVGALVALGAAAAGAGASNDRFFADQWNLTQIGAPDAWKVTTGSGILIGKIGRAHV